MNTYIPFEVILLTAAVMAVVIGIVARQIEAIIIAIIAICITTIYTIGVHYDMDSWWAATTVAPFIFGKYLNDNLKFKKKN